MHGMYYTKLQLFKKVVDNITSHFFMLRLCYATIKKNIIQILIVEIYIRYVIWKYILWIYKRKMSMSTKVKLLIRIQIFIYGVKCFIYKLLKFPMSQYY